jgi:signal transduction histidine kinase
VLRSIRWRLVISYVLLSLLIVSVIGVLTLSLVKQQIEQRVVEDLTANAESVARQAGPLMWPVVRLPALTELARTAAFLGDVRVRILDTHDRLLADSGSNDGVNSFMWFAPPEGWGPEVRDRSWLMVVPMGPSRHVVATPDLSALGSEQGDVRWTIVQRSAGVWGTRLSFEELLQEPSLQLFPEPKAVEGAIEQPDQEQETSSRSQQMVTALIGARDNPLGHVELSSGPDFGAQALATTRRALILAGGGALALALVTGLAVSQGLTAPLRRLAAAASRMSDDLSTRAPTDGKDEIDQVAIQLNHMAERLEASFAALTADRDALRRFVADASHELRTPITALKSFNELLQGAAADDPGAREEFLAESATQLDRLEWITANLLNLSRLDAGLAALEKDTWDVGELVEAVGSSFHTLAIEKGITLGTQVPAEPVHLLCDRARLEMALCNLVDNGMKFTPRGGRVEIGVEETGESIRFWVSDDGPGIDPADQPHVFERFYRGRSNQQQGSGLGLAIVRSVAQAHGGRVQLESTPGAGTRISMELDRALPPT